MHALYSWRPLGALLLEKGFVTDSELDAALAEQRRTGRLIGQILVESGCISAFSLARALAEQNGVELDRDSVDPVETVVTMSAPGHVIYEVREVGYEPRYQAQEVLYESASFLEAVDFAAEFVEDNDPDGVEIQRADRTGRETVWAYSESRASATAASRKGLAETFGFDPTLWDGAAAR